MPELTRHSQQQAVAPATQCNANQVDSPRPMRTHLQGNIAIFTGYLVLLAASIDGWLAVLLLVLIAVIWTAVAIRQRRP